MFYPSSVCGRASLILVTCLITAAVISVSTKHQPQDDDAAALTARASMPLSFEANQGQTDPSVRFLARGPGYNLFLKPTEATLTIADTNGGLALKCRLLDADNDAEIFGESPLPGTANYFIGNRQVTDIPTFERVVARNVYPGIELVHYGKQGRLEYDFVVRPGADPRVIRMAVDGADSVNINPDGQLILTGNGREVYWDKPVCYQVQAGRRAPVEGRFTIDADDTVGFEIAQYDVSRELVIDPVLVYSTYVRPTTVGSGNNVVMRSIAVDSSGNAYVAGTADSPNYPTTAGAYDTAHNGGYDVVIAKVNPTGSALVFSTYLGGSGNDGLTSYPSIAIGSDNSVYVTGDTYSTNFPVTVGAYQTTSASGPASDDVFVTKLHPNGNALVYSTYIGGSAGDGANAIAVDADGHAYVGGGTSSSHYPTTPGAFQGVFGSCAFVTKLATDGASLSYSTALGSNSVAEVNGIALDADRNVYVTGVTQSGYPTTPGAFQEMPTAGAANFEAFLTKINPTGSALVYSTYFGGASADEAFDVAVDLDGSAYICGATLSTNLPVTVGSYQTVFPPAGGFYNGFVTKFDTTGSALAYSTFLGGNANDTPQGIAVRSNGNAIVVGNTASTNYPVVAASAIQTNLPNASFAGMITELDATGSNLVFSSYIGGTVADSLNSVALDDDGMVYVCGSGGANFPTTPGAFQTDDLFDAIGGGIVAKLNIGSGSSGTVECSLSPSVATNNINTAHLVTATILSNSVPLSGVTVNFEVTGGPNVGQIGVDSTDAQGDATFQYTGGATTGTDTISATGAGFSCDATVEWIDSSLFSADLVVSKKANKSQVVRNKKLVYTISVTNSGPDVATGIVVTDTLPLNVAVVAGSTTPGYTLAGRTLEYDLGSLGAGEGTNLVVAIKPKVTGKIVNKVNVAANEPDPNTTNNFAKAKATVVP
jgi:uncharacterized repeat protein (TIGR01451 family)